MKRPKRTEPRQQRPLNDAQRLRRLIRQRAGRLLREHPSLAPVKPAIVRFCESDAACADLFALCRADPTDLVLRDRYLQQQLEARHAFRVLQPYLPPPKSTEDWEDDNDDILD